MMTLIKITEDNYVVVDDSKIEVGDWYIDDAKQIRKALVSDEVYWQHRPYNREYMKIIRSTEIMPYGKYGIARVGDRSAAKVRAMFLQEVKELLGVVDVEKKAREQYSSEPNDYEEEWYLGYIRGYNHALEDNKEKRFTQDDMIGAFIAGANAGALRESLRDYDTGNHKEAEQGYEYDQEMFIQSLQPKTEWEVELVNGKLKLAK